ncbi:PREDICTED: odorant receptor 13a-like [Ceratosolen solmsi marchali]|uniref:Odorant receptor n=1 Tax=Ceratosolen solmsi marchali TaxID=326594 RepID=A0AAJ6YLX6_9HYME|nr:PREDICTED: odorant receptor 13a-like [Ceratosolen solmsi marchali]
MFLFAIVAQTTMVLKVWGDLNAVIEILTTADMPICVALMKFLVAWYYREVLKDLVKTMSDDWQSQYTNQDFEEMWQRAQFSRKLSIVCIGLAQGTITVQFLMVVVFDINNKGQIERPLYMTSYFPYDTQNSPNYEITWIAQCFSNIFAAGAFSAVDAFFVVLVLHLCGQLAILKRSLIELTDDLQHKSIKLEFTRKLANIVERHEFLNRFAKTIEDSFNMMFLAQMITSSFALCLQGYQLIITSNEDKLPLLQLIHMIYFVCCFSFSLFSYCYVAEQLNYESTEIHYAAYKSDWYNLCPKETKLLLLLMHRARKPLEITAGKFCVFSLELYCSILKTSGGYLSMLLAVRNRLVPAV